MAAVHALTGLEFAERLLTGGLFGVAIGVERQWRQRMAGLHTCALVATGATLFALIGPLLGVEPLDRVVANIVSGVGFLAGGVILREGWNVRGLNTAATIWATAAVGTLAGVGAPLYAALGAIAVLALNVALSPLADAIDTHTKEAIYEVSIVCRDATAHDVRSAIIDSVSASKELALRSMSVAAQDGESRISVQLADEHRDDKTMITVLEGIAGRPGVTSSDWRFLGDG